MENGLNIVIFVHFLKHVPINFSFPHLPLCLEIDNGIDSILLHGIDIFKSKRVRTNKDSLFIKPVQLKLKIEVGIAFIDKTVNNIAGGCFNLLCWLAQHAIILGWILNFDGSIWISFNDKVGSKSSTASLNPVFVVESKCLVNLFSLLVFKLDLTLVWSDKFAILFLEPVIFLEALAHFDCIFPTSKFFFWATNIHVFLIVKAWVEDSKSNIEWFPFVIDLGNFLLLASERFSIQVRNLARVWILGYELEISDPVNTFLPRYLLASLIKEDVFVHEVLPRGDNRLFSLPDISVTPLELAELVVLPHAKLRDVANHCDGLAPFNFVFAA